MTRRIKRGPEYDLTLNIKDDTFMATPKASQRSWLLNRLMHEADLELKHLNSIAPRLIRGSDATIDLDREYRELPDQEIMEDWQIPVMQHMAACVAQTQGDVLEIGMGRGVASGFVQACKPRSHTLVECNDAVVAKFPQWRQNYPDSNITLLHGRWQDCTEQLDCYDGILFHTYPLNEQEFVSQVVNSVTFAEHFFTTAANHLNAGGVLTYLTNEIDSLSRAHQRSLLQHFSQFKVSMIRDLDIPADTKDALWLNQMVLIEVTK